MNHNMHTDKQLEQTRAKCDECKKLQRRRREALKNDESYKNFQAITEKDWTEGIFEGLPIQQGNIWEAPSEYNVILPCSAQIDSNDREVRRAIAKFRGKEGLKTSKTDREHSSNNTFFEISG